MKPVLLSFYALSLLLLGNVGALEEWKKGKLLAGKREFCFLEKVVPDKAMRSGANVPASNAKAKTFSLPCVGGVGSTLPNLQQNTNLPADYRPPQRRSLVEKRMANPSTGDCWWHQGDGDSNEVDKVAFCDVTKDRAIAVRTILMTGRNGTPLDGSVEYNPSATQKV